MDASLRARSDLIFEGLNDAQRAAVAAVTGPVCILAGAGSGKTTTITRRLAHQVISGAFSPAALLAVTFTDKAATEMRTRLQALGAEGIRARTFHSAALGQLNYFRPGAIERIVASKAQLLAPICARLPRPHRFVPVGDYAGEIEWAKNQRIGVDDYLDRLGGHEPPSTPELMRSIYRDYERRKRAAGGIDFEDMLEAAVTMFEEDEDIQRMFASRYRAFTVDEYQDVNLLQQALLDRWLAGRDELCVVGDDYQSIYSFTGASPDHLLSMGDRYPGLRSFSLEENYRSSPQILDLANRLVPHLGGVGKVLRATRLPGPRPVLRGHVDASQQPRAVVETIVRLHSDDGVPYEDMAILYRINARSEAYEDSLADAGIPYRVWEGAFLTRPAARQMLARLRANDSHAIAEVVTAAATELGYDPNLPSGVGRQEQTRQKDLERFIRLAEAFEDGSRSTRDLVADLEARFARDAEGRGVNLLTLHRAKGLEFDAVFVVGVEEGELPHKRASVDEERRLFYVGLTRAKRHLYVSWVWDPKRRASPFVGELGVEGTSARGPTTASRASRERAPDTPLIRDLKAWRRERAVTDDVPAYVVMHDKTLEEIARVRPTTLGELAVIAGMGPVKCERYGADIIRVVAQSD